MGIDTKIINEWLPANIPKSIPWSINPFTYIHPTSYEVRLLDLTERIRKVQLNGKDQLTTLEVCESLFKTILKYQNPGDTNYLILMLDKKTFVPPEKTQTQLKRIENSKKQDLYPYPRGSILKDGGVMLPDNTIELIQTQRLAISWFLILDLVDIFTLYLTRHHQLSSLPFNLVLDCLETEPPTLFSKDSQIESKITWANDIGEVDLRICFYMQQFSYEYSFVIYATDTDILPVCLRYLSETTTHLPAGLLFVRDESKELTKAGPKPTKKNPNPPRIELVKCIDILVLYHALLDGQVNIFKNLPEKLRENQQHKSNHLIRQRVLAFVLGCILCGTDYYYKKTLSHFFGIEAIFQAVVDGWDIPPFGLFVFAESDRPRYKNAIIRFVHTLYGTLIRSTRGGGGGIGPSYMVIIEGSGYNNIDMIDQTAWWIQNEVYFIDKRYIVATSIVINDAVVKLKFNWSYWGSHSIPMEPNDSWAVKRKKREEEDPDTTQHLSDGDDDEKDNQEVVEQSSLSRVRSKPLPQEQQTVDLTRSQSSSDIKQPEQSSSSSGIDLAILGSGMLSFRFDVFQEKVDEFLRSINNPYINHILSGGRDGIETMTIRWAKEHGYPLRIFHPDFNRYKTDAEAFDMRNQQMIKACSHLILFESGNAPVIPISMVIGKVTKRYNIETPSLPPLPTPPPPQKPLLGEWVLKKRKAIMLDLPSLESVKENKDMEIEEEEEEEQQTFPSLPQDLPPEEEERKREHKQEDEDEITRFPSLPEDLL